MRGVSAALASLGAAKLVLLIQGEIKQFRSWLKAVEKYIKLHKIANDSNKILIAFKPAPGQSAVT